MQKFRVSPQINTDPIPPKIEKYDEDIFSFAAKQGSRFCKLVKYFALLLLAILAVLLLVVFYCKEICDAVLKQIPQKY